MYETSQKVRATGGIAKALNQRAAIKRAARLTFVIAVAVGLGVTLGGLAEARGQCEPRWLPGEGIPGLNGWGLAMTTWDPDGAGPLPELLVVAGDFTFAGGVLANNVAAWDGSHWQALGTGLDDIVEVLAVYNGELIAGGRFTTAGGMACSRIARWDGNQWQSLGAGMNDTVRNLTIYNGELIAGGWFTTAGGVACNRIARWDGSQWRPLGTGMNGSILALAVFNGELIAGGSFTTAGGVSCNRMPAGTAASGGGWGWE